MKHIKFLVFMLLLYSTSSFAQKKENIIYWSKEYQLIWDDFKAKPPAGTDHGGVSCVSIFQRFIIKNNILEIDARSSFDKS